MRGGALTASRLNKGWVSGTGMPLSTLGQTLVGCTAKWILYLGACLTETGAL